VKCDGCRLFAVEHLRRVAGASLVRPTGENNDLFMPKTMWNQLGGFDGRFVMAGGRLSESRSFAGHAAAGGAAHHPLSANGPLQQIHGGIANLGRIGSEEAHAEYVGVARPAAAAHDRTFVRRKRAQSAPVHIEDSVELALAQRRRQR
jgi:hypothetical protein